jgi:carbonic anhydrase
VRDVNNFLTGFRRFQAHYLGRRHEEFRRLVEQGQQPRAVVIACCDSRSDPALITDCGPGEMFVIRNVANLVPPHVKAGGYAGVSSAIEFGVCQLHAEHIIVLGHAQCGGIRALMTGMAGCAESEFIGRWLEIAAPTRDQVRQELGHKPLELQLRACEQGALLVSLENLMTYPWIRQRVAAGSLALHAWYFDMLAGELLGFNPAASRFENMVAAVSRQDPQ